MKESMTASRPPMTAEERRRLHEMAERILNSELGPMLIEMLGALYEHEMAKRAAGNGAAADEGGERRTPKKRPP